MNLTDILQHRYSVKAFDATKKISPSDFEQLKQAMQFSPSSVNGQAWHFIIADDEAGKARIAKSCENFAFNTPKVLNASHCVVFCAKLSADDAHLNAVLDQEEKDGRFAAAENKARQDAGRRGFIDLHRTKFNDENQWLEKQVYLNIGFTLMAAAALNIDAVPMEGVDLSVLNQEFGLTEKGLSAVAVVSFGYRGDDDFNAKLPKSRLPQTLIFSKA